MHRCITLSRPGNGRVVRISCFALVTFLLWGAAEIGPLAPAAHAAATRAALPTAGGIDLGAATPYSVLGASTVTSTGNTVVGGELGVSPGTSVVGFPAGVILVNSGAFHSADPSAASARQAAKAAFQSAQGRRPDVRYPPIHDIGSSTLAPGVYQFPLSAGISGSVILDGGGNRNAVFVFLAGSTLIAESHSRVVLVNGARAGNVWWQVGSSATLKVGSSLAGTIIAQESVTVQTDVSVEGRVFALDGAVTLDSDRFTAVPDVGAAPTTEPPSPPRPSPLPPLPARLSPARPSNRRP